MSERDIIEKKIIKNKIKEIIKEPVFLMKDIVEMLTVLGLTDFQNKARDALKDKRILPKNLGLKCSHGLSKTSSYRLSDVWELFISLDEQNLINLKIEGLNNPEDLIRFDFEIIHLERQTIGFTPRKNDRYDSLLSEGIWDNTVRALEK